MRMPVICGMIERRLLINYQVDPEVLAKRLPAPFRPQVVQGRAMVGICLIRLKRVRPHGMPRWMGIRSENAAHRAAVQWWDAGRLHCGVYVFRRDTNSRMNAAAGGRFFPGEHHFGRFRVREANGHYRLSVGDGGGEDLIDVDARDCQAWPAGSVFASLEEASAFFEAGSIGYSPSSRPGCFQGLELRCSRWQARPLAIANARSAFFDDESLFPAGSIQLDCGLAMHSIEHQWHAQPDIYHAAAGSGSSELMASTTSE